MTPRTSHLLACSGGKDSTATGLHLRELGIEFTAHFYDTGWERPETYDYLATLEHYLGPITVHVAPQPALDERREAMAHEVEELVGRAPSGFVRWCLHKAAFPRAIRQRWCTQLLKMEAARALMRSTHDAGELPVSAIGIRAAESATRAALPEREIDTGLDCVVWRPILRWSVADVAAIHRRHGVAPNPLYLQGATRVGCWPCIGAGGAELRLLDARRVQAIELLERFVAELAREQHGEHPEGPPALFQRHTRDSRGKRPCYPISEAVAWARKSGEQAETFPGMSSGCMTWGLCDTGEEP